MTLGNGPQPLTRRQARELAQSQQGSTTTDEAYPQATASDQSLPSSVFSEPPAQAESFTELIQKAEAAAKASAEALPVQRRAREPLGTEPDDGHFGSREQTMTRRELRAVKAAQDETDTSAADVSSEEAPTVLLPIAATIPAADADSSRGLHPPVGHWSIDPEVRGDAEHVRVIDPVQAFDQLISRGLGAGGIPTTTNALILPAVALHDRTSGPLTSTGEILVTGSIDLPRSLGSTGAHPDRFDSSDGDHLLDQIDEPGATTDVAPVSASRAVSSHASTRGVMTPPKKDAAWLPTVLAITAAALALGVIALFVGAFIFNIF
ncbi:hypothetical protein [Glaciibacter psychrotolerans]|uniref:Uncharacterized protein n=1 Tax=Glaciibacter psychrotolerans TaxID=670054 RepID=A0A7Z0J541_9MICO|nr:hypothetical protein [Leifsonia psychrotolerans]NYJ18995.1 hypothetical protein [Leifsonia psychrotolerans]